MQVTVIRTTGEIEEHQVDRFTEVRKLIDAETTDAVNLRDGRVMLVDDNGWAYEVVEVDKDYFKHVPTFARKPVNREATRLYHSVCKPGTTHQIVGDVAIVIDAEVR